VRLQIAEQKIVTGSGSQVRTVCRVVGLTVRSRSRKQPAVQSIVDLWIGALSWISIQPDSSRQHSSAFLLDGVTQRQQQTDVVLSIHYVVLGGR